MLWNLRLGHVLPQKAIVKHVRSGLLPHVHSLKVYCDDCLKGKFKRSYRGSQSKEDNIGTLHVDTKGNI